MAVIISALLFLFNGVVTSYAYAADAIPGEQWCDRDVARIQFSGNKVTRDPVLRRELVQQQDTACSLDDVIDGIQNIMDLGLFKSVRAELHLNDTALELRYVVVEKIFFLPIPRFSRTSDGELRYGAQLRWDNFMGRLHRLKLTSEKRQENDGRGRTGFVHTLDYSVPRFFNSFYGMSMRAATQRRNIELSRNQVVFGEGQRSSRLLEWRLARWANDELGIRGLSYFAGFGLQEREYEVKSGELGPFRDGRDLSLIAGMRLQRVHQETYRRRGHSHDVSLRVADKFFGTSFRYTRLDIASQWYLPLSRHQTNLNIQLRLGLSDRAPFGEHSYTLGGGELLRGMDTDKKTGNILTLVNIEYLSGLFAYPAWRWVFFTDIGNVYLPGDVNLLNQQIRVGAGLRWKLESLTNTDIRFDLAWDPDKEKLTPYLSTSLTF